MNDKFVNKQEQKITLVNEKLHFNQEVLQTEYTGIDSHAPPSGVVDEFENLQEEKTSFPNEEINLSQEELPTPDNAVDFHGPSPSGPSSLLKMDQNQEV